jgi:restriction system protein
MLGRGSVYAKQCREEGFIGAGFNIEVDLSDSLFENWRDFNKKFIPVWMNNVPGKSKVVAGLACGALWTIVKGLRVGDIVLCPSGEGYYYVGIVDSDYYYMPVTELPHRRKVSWLDKVIDRKSMSNDLRNSTGSIGTCADVTKYAEEIESLINGTSSGVSHSIPKKSTNLETTKHFDERSLHKLFCSFLRTRGIYAKTIYHEK